jgi:cell division protein FtsB
LKQKKKSGVKFFAEIFSLLFMLSLFSVPAAFADNDVKSLKEQLQAMSRQMEELQKRITAMETAESEKKDQIKEMDNRLNQAELHTTTDKISFNVDLRTRAESIHYEDLAIAPSGLTNGFFVNVPAGFNGGTLAQIQGAIAGMQAAGMIPPVEKYDVDNDIIFSNRFRLEMQSKVNNNLSFAGRLAANKVYGDSTGVNFNHGSLGDVTFDGNTSSLPHGDTIRLERAYFNYKNNIGNVPYNLSMGRRPSTEGPPFEYRNNSLEGGSPLSTIINWQFDGASLNFGLEDVTNIPGFDFKLCYGVGFESDYGNSSSLSSTSDVSDVHMAGFIATLFNNDTLSAVLNYAYAWDITDGFTGLTVMPFIAYKNDANNDGVYEYYFEKNYGGFISRLEPSTNIGDWQAASLLLRANFTEWLDKNIDVFMSGSWTHTDPSQISKNPFYEIMGQGLLSSNGDLESRDGYMLYLGALFPMPLKAKFGLEFNYGSKYWFNFTGAEDSIVGSKLATRGQVYEAYYIQPIIDRNFYMQLGGQYYDYEYTGSGNPLGAPVKIGNLSSLDALFPVVDELWNVYLSATLRW